MAFEPGQPYARMAAGAFGPVNSGADAFLVEVRCDAPSRVLHTTCVFVISILRTTCATCGLIKSARKAIGFQASSHLSKRFVYATSGQLGSR